MFVNMVQFGYFVLFGVIKTPIGQTLVGKTRSDVTLVFEFLNCQTSCDEIIIFFNRFQYSSSRNRLYLDEHVMTFTYNGIKCLHIIGYKYETRILNVSINLPRYVTFGIRNISVYDSGRYFISDISREKFGKIILLVGDTILRTCTLKKMVFEFVLPLSDLNETIAVVFCSGISWSEDIVSICNPKAGTCVPPPRATFLRFECRMNGSRITITLTSVQMEDEGLYALIGSTSRIAYQSAVLDVIDCVSTSAAFDVEFNTTELPNLTTTYVAVNNNGNTNSKAIISSAAPITGEPGRTTEVYREHKEKTACINNEDKSFENYFVGGGFVAGMTIVILICCVLWKRCYEIRGNGAGNDDYNTVDVHYYCSIRNQNEPVTQSEATTGSVPESQQLSAVMC